MKRLIIALCLVIMEGQFYNNYAQFTEPSITFDKTSFNFGNINELDGLKTHVFSFTNNGSQPLIINDITSTCGCTVPEWIKEPIPPGGTGTVKVTFDPLGRPGAFRKNIAVKTNARESTVVLYIVGLVSPKPKTVADDFPIKIGNLRLATNHVSMQTVLNSQIKVDTVRIFNDSDSLLNVSISDAPVHLSFSVLPPSLEPKKRGLIYVAFDARKMNDWGFVLSRVIFRLNGVPVTENMLAVSATIQEDFSKLTPEQKLSAPRAKLDEESFNFGTITPGQPVAHDFILKNEGKDPLIIRKISTTCGCTASKPDKYEIKGGESTTLKCTFDSRGKIGKQFQTVTLIVNDPLQSMLVLRFIGNVESTGK
ncbi:MAG: DUF1573 domain-containing protein [Porphyromonadaceae bacterium]|nr:MAG: DUF1573 domain-containing protein [Porphyromonadaceae bacterium]